MLAMPESRILPQFGRTLSSLVRPADVVFGSGNDGSGGKCGCGGKCGGGSALGGGCGGGCSPSSSSGGCGCAGGSTARSGSNGGERGSFSPEPGVSSVGWVLGSSNREQDYRARSRTGGEGPRTGDGWDHEPCPQWCLLEYELYQQCCYDAWRTSKTRREYEFEMGLCEMQGGIYGYLCSHYDDCPMEPCRYAWRECGDQDDETEKEDLEECNRITAALGCPGLNNVANCMEWKKWCFCPPNAKRPSNADFLCKQALDRFNKRCLTKDDPRWDPTDCSRAQCETRASRNAALCLVACPVLALACGTAYAACFKACEGACALKAALEMVACSLCKRP